MTLKRELAREDIVVYDLSPTHMPDFVRSLGG